ncbi:extracellular solute-binding protein [Bosea sp. (in: a-proteobacteria)]|jgi:putative spermidine/putrescine transport system substrate-binding protein|uniref:extracellular solute-binding protein n=1 Tax=Bosea sp. (in: a-proteobacteria) TaxID=1871050 RepID=UPI003F7123CA
MKGAWLAAVCAAGIVTTTANAQQSLTVIAYGGLFQERYTKTVIEPFQKAFPEIKVNYFGLPTSGQMLGTLRAQKAAPQADVAILDITVSKAGTDENVFAPIDETSVPNVAELRPEARVPGVAGVGVTFDSFSLIYNSELVKTAPTGLKDLTSVDLKGKVAFSGMPDIIGLSAIAVMDKLEGGPGLSGRYEKGYAFMTKVAPNILTWEPQPEIYPVVISGQAATGLGWNARAQLNAKNSSGKLKVVLPSEGTIFQINTINLVNKAPNIEAAKTFINYALSAETQKRFTEDMYYAPTNSKVQVDTETASRTALTQMDKVIPVDWLAVAKMRDSLMDKWRREVVPLSR